MKSSVIHPKENKYNFAQADEFVSFGESNQMAIIGHCLIWHSQLAPWFCVDKDGNNVSPEVLKKRMKDHITTIVKRYKGRIKGWDVVNEAIEDNGAYRKTKFYEILGEEYIPLAFQYAHEADPDAELYYNDYSMAQPGRREAVVKMVNDLKKRGIRIDAVSAMLYLDFGKQEGEYVPNEDGTNINYEAVDFLRNLNEALRTTYEGFLTIAEESTAYPKVTSDIDDPDGLGFVYKWNMGYMHDSLYYMELDPLYRKDNHGAIIFSMDYAYSENYILPYSHDEVVHGKGSMINKMYGAYDEKFASLRTLYGFTIAHPGKKLLFMGGEFAQFVEWRDKEQLDWFLIDQYEMHDSFHEYVAKLNEIYKAHPAFYELDQDPAGFEWCLQRDADHSVVAFIRKSKRGRGRKQEQILCVCNFTPMEWDKYLIPLPKKSKLTKILDLSLIHI